LVKELGANLITDRMGGTPERDWDATDPWVAGAHTSATMAAPAMHSHCCVCGEGIEGRDHDSCNNHVRTSEYSLRAVSTSDVVETALMQIDNAEITYFHFRVHEKAYSVPIPRGKLEHIQTKGQKRLDDVYLPEDIFCSEREAFVFFQSVISFNNDHTPPTFLVCTAEYGLYRLLVQANATGFDLFAAAIQEDLEKRQKRKK
jgi:hypothetical protein